MNKTRLEQALENIVNDELKINEAFVLYNKDGQTFKALRTFVRHFKCTPFEAMVALETMKQSQLENEMKHTPDRGIAVNVCADF